jgi:conjugal transfer pilus assembly protein TraV
MRAILIAPLAAAILGGCASTLSGMSGESQFACKAPDGVTCSSLSGVHANAVAGNLPGLRKSDHSTVADTAQASTGAIHGSVPESGSPVRAQSRTLRVWIAPWEDREGDLHDQSYIYVVADHGRWQIEHNRMRIVDRYRPTFASPSNGKVAPKQEAQPTQPSAYRGVTLPGNQSYQPATPIQGYGDAEDASQ